MTSERESLGELQLQVMQVVWELGDGTVAEVHEALCESRPLAYTTVLSTLRGLERRDYVSHTTEGKAHRFSPRVSREQHTDASISKLVTNLFGGQPEKLMSHLMGGEELDDAQRRRIRALLAEEGER